MTWLDHLQTRPQAIDDPQVSRDVIAAWPDPCRICGAHWKLTPGKRFHIQHFYGPHHQGEQKRFVGEAA